MKNLAALAALVVCASANAYDVTSEVNYGDHDEIQMRVGPRFALSPHWSIDTGVSVISFKDFTDSVEMIDATIQHRNFFGRNYVDFGTGLALWTAKNWDVQRSGTQWTFSNRLGFGRKLANGAEVGIVWRHYSNLAFSPNTCKDFGGIHVSFPVN